MISQLRTYAFVAESLGDVFDCLISLAGGYDIEQLCIREVAGLQVVHVTTTAGIDCISSAMADDEMMSPTY